MTRFDYVFGTLFVLSVMLLIVSAKNSRQALERDVLNASNKGFAAGCEFGIGQANRLEEGDKFYPIWTEFCNKNAIWYSTQTESK
jgi:hypothetical protein